MRRYLAAFILFFPLALFALTPEKSSDSIVIQAFAEQNIPITENNKIKLLPGGKEKFEDLFVAIQEAKHHVHLEYFNFRNDSIATELFKLLASKVKEGVEVRALFDAFGNISNNRPLKKKHLKQIQSTGVEIVKFDPIRFPYINHVMHRDHRKIVVIDGKIGYTGGINIADYYINGLPDIGEWRDFHIRIEGSAVKYLQQIFLKIWNKQTKQHIGGPQYFPDPAWIPKEERVNLAIVDREPRVTPKAIRKAYSISISAAKEKIQIINPYFLPTRSVKKSIHKAIKNGTQVDIIIPLRSDIPFTPSASLYAANKLRKKGANIYLYQEGFHHAKIMMIDDKFCTVGTSNLDSRSLRYDYETNVFIFDEGTTKELSNLFKEDKTKSIPLDQEFWKSRTNWQKFVGWFAHLFTPFL